MKITKAESTNEIKMGATMTAYEYSHLSDKIQGAVIKLNGRYPEEGRVVNEVCTEIGYVIEGLGKIVVEGQEAEISEGDQIVIEPGERYYWDAHATLFKPCSPAWYPEQHKEVE